MDRNTTYSSIPVNRNARKRMHRRARMGARPAPSPLNVGDAVHAISAAAAYKSGWDSSTADLPSAIRAAWAVRGS